MTIAAMLLAIAAVDRLDRAMSSSGEAIALAITAAAPALPMLALGHDRAATVVD